MYLETAELTLMYFDVWTIQCGTYIHIADRSEKCSQTQCWKLYLGEVRGVCRVFVVKPEGKGPLGRPRHRREENIKIYLKEMACGVMDWLMCLRIRTGGGVLWMRYWNFMFHKVGKTCWPAEDLSASQEGLCSMELVSWLAERLRIFSSLCFK